ncbi:hypothetical protein [Dyadobacter diqingensis]|uniref:hypothetical protein n=1 Tax=Dyadobacter diqingensis TaxID=2938121 RepID=UPI0020C1B8E1|nr:hypothetical protein [Dyadobacter diqingensis]
MGIYLLPKTVLRAMFAVAMLCGPSSLFAQVKVGDNPTIINAGSVLEIESTNKGLQLPRIALTNTTTWGLLGTPSAGMHVYNTNLSITSTNVNYPTLAAKKGQYYWDGSGWVALAPLIKSTSVTSSTQTLGHVINFPTTASPLCDVYTEGSPPPACATFLDMQGTFNITQSSNDVIFDLAVGYVTSNNSIPVNFSYVLYLDKTTPGVFEQVGVFYTTSGGDCYGQSVLAKFAAKDLPIRSYTAKVYLAPWVNFGTPCTIGVGAESSPGCGRNVTTGNKLILSVSQ